MKIGRRPDTQGLIDEQLPRRRRQQVLAAHDFGDAHRVIVHGDGQVVGWQVVISPDNKIAKVPAGDKALGAEAAVFKSD